MGWLKDLLAPENLLALLGVVVTVGVLSYERLIPGRKRIGYRIQMDTVIDAADGADDELYQRLDLLENLPDLAGASLVLLRIENDGFRGIDAGDYITAPEHNHGLTVTFPNRTVQDVAVTEPSDPTLLRFLPRSDSTAETPGLTWAGSDISLPRVPLNRGDHFKLLVLLTGARGQRHPRVRGRIKEGRIRNNDQFRRPNNRMLGLIGSLVVLVVAQPFAFQLLRDTPLPEDCAGGDLTVVGSTAFEPVMKDLGRGYEENCLNAPHISTVAQGSKNGISTLEEQGGKAGGAFVPYLALSDGPTQNRDRMLQKHPVAVSVYALVVNEDVQLRSVRLADLQRLFKPSDDAITDWAELTGPGEPANGRPLRVTLVGRTTGSGTREVFENRLLDRHSEPTGTSEAYDCATRTHNEPVTLCEQSNTQKVLEAVAGTPGAIGYAELHNAEEYIERDNRVRLLSLNGARPSIDAVRAGTYLFWEPEYAYTYGTPPNNSLMSKFLDYLHTNTGQNIMAQHGHLPCAAPENQQACQEAEDEDGER